MPPKRQIRYEEYAAYGIVDEVENGIERIKITPVRSTTAPSENRSIKGVPFHSAASSHRANDKYMDEFDDAYEEMAKRSDRPRGKSEQSARDHVSKPTPTRSTRPSDPFDESSSSPGDLNGSWRTGPQAPDGNVHSPSAQPLMCMSLSMDQREIVVGSSDHALYTIPLRSDSTRRASNSGGRPRTLYTKKFGHTEWVTCSLYLSDQRIVSGGMDSKLCLWEATGVKCEDLLGHSGSITLLKPLFKDNGLILSASYDKTIRIWNVSRTASSRQREVSTMKVGMAPILDVSVFPITTSSSIISGDRDGSVHIVDVHEGKVSRKMTNAHKGHTTSVLASRYGDGMIPYSGGQDGIVNLWDLRQKPMTAQPAGARHVDLKSGKAGAVGFLLEPLADDNVLISGGADGTIHVMDKRKGYKTLFQFTEHLDFIYSMHVHGSLCFSGAGNGMLHVHDWKKGKLLYGLGANKAAVRAIESTDHQLIAAGDDGSVIVYDMD